MNELIFNNQDLELKIRAIKNADGSISINAEDTAIGFGWIQTKNNITYVRWETINGYLKEFGFSQEVGKDDYIPESLFYLLGMKAKNETALRFQNWLALEVIPSIRKTGSYSTNQTKQLTALEQLQLQSEAILEVNTKVDEVINKVNELEDNTTINYGQQEVINKTAKESVVNALGGKDTPAYKELNKKVFSSFWKDYKRVMQVASYRDTLVKDYDKALDFITAWHPNRDLELMIIGCNAQIEMEEI